MGVPKDEHEITKLIEELEEKLDQVIPGTYEVKQKKEKRKFHTDDGKKKVEGIAVEIVPVDVDCELFFPFEPVGNQNLIRCHLHTKLAGVLDDFFKKYR